MKIYSIRYWKLCNCKDGACKITDSILQRNKIMLCLLFTYIFFVNPIYCFQQRGIKLIHNKQMSVAMVPNVQNFAVSSNEISCT